MTEGRTGGGANCTRKRRANIELRWVGSENFGELFRLIRESKGLTQAQVAECYTLRWRGRYPDDPKPWTDRWIGHIESDAVSRPWLSCEQVDLLAQAMGCTPFEATQLLLASGHVSPAEVVLLMVGVTLPATNVHYHEPLVRQRARLARLPSHGGALESAVRAEIQRDLAEAEAQFVADYQLALLDVYRIIQRKLHLDAQAQAPKGEPSSTELYREP